MARAPGRFTRLMGEALEDRSLLSSYVSPASLSALSAPTLTRSGDARYIFYPPFYPPYSWVTGVDSSKSGAFSEEHSIPGWGEFQVDGNVTYHTGENAGGSATYDGSHITVTTAPINGAQVGDPIGIRVQSRAKSRAEREGLTSARFEYWGGYTLNGQLQTMMAEIETGTWSTKEDSAAWTFNTVIGAPFEINFYANAIGSRLDADAAGDFYIEFACRIAVNGPTDLIAGSITWNPGASSHLVSYEYMFGAGGSAGSPQVQPFPVHFYWADRSGNRLGSPVYQFVADEVAERDGWRHPGSFTLTREQLAAMPEDATQLIMVLDPDRTVPEANRENNVAKLAAPDLRVASVKWNTDRSTNHQWEWTDKQHPWRGIDVEIEITHGAVDPLDVGVAFYWATGDRWEDRRGEAITSWPLALFTPIGPGRYKVNEGAFRSVWGLPPKDEAGRQVSRILVVVDPKSDAHPNGDVLESDEGNNVASLAIHTPEEILAEGSMRFWKVTIPKNGLAGGFYPGNGRYTMSEAEVVMGVDHFNWVQLVYLPDAWRICAWNQGAKRVEELSNGFLDPITVQSGHQEVRFEGHDETITDFFRVTDTKIFYWDEDRRGDYYDVRNRTWTYSLDFGDSPNLSFLRQSEVVSFSTYLAGVDIWGNLVQFSIPSGATYGCQWTWGRDSWGTQDVLSKAPRTGNAAPISRTTVATVPAPASSTSGQSAVLTATGTSSVTITVAEAALDLDGSIDFATVSIVSPPLHGTAVLGPGPGQVTYTPGPDYAGSDGFLYSVRDREGAVSNDAPVLITAGNLGATDFWELPNLVPSACDLEYSFRTVRSGILTLDATAGDAANTAGIVLTLSNQDHQVLMTTTAGSPRIDVATAAGVTYYVKLTGASRNVDLRVANLLQLSADGTAATLRGTATDDVFEIAAFQDHPSGYIYGVMVNGVVYPSSYYPGLKSFAVYAGAGADRLRLTGSPENDVATLRPNSGTAAMPGMKFSFSQVEATTFRGGGGADTAALYDSAGDDTFTFKPQETTLTGSGYANRLEDVRTVTAWSTAGGSDVARLYDSSGNDALTATPDYTKMTAEGKTAVARLFDKTYAYATAGGTDTASLYDSTGSDTFYGLPTYAYLTGTGFYNYAGGFDKVYAYATATNVSGAADRANLYDSTGSDTFYGLPTYSYLTGIGFYNYAGGFDKVYAYATAVNVAAATDRAFLYDSTGADTFYGRAAYGYLFGSGFYNYVTGFNEVTADGSKAGTNRLNIAALDYFFQHPGTWS